MNYLDKYLDINRSLIYLQKFDYWNNEQEGIFQITSQPTVCFLKVFKVQYKHAKSTRRLFILNSTLSTLGFHIVDFHCFDIVKFNVLILDF